MQLGRKLSQEAIARRTKTWKARGYKSWNKGIPVSVETKRKISRGLLGNTPWNKGKSLPPDIRNKISRGLIGRPVSEKSKQIFLAMASRPKSKEHRLKLAAAAISKPVRCIETGVSYVSLSAASAEYGVSHTAIYLAIRRSGHCCKLHWKYENGDSDE
jgi:hypothetical protein